MKDTQDKLFGNQIIIDDDSQFYYTIKPYELSNALGNIITVLQEYNFMKKEDINRQSYGKLYKTTEGNWYDIEEVKPASEKKILRMLKSAIDAKENDSDLPE